MGKIDLESCFTPVSAKQWKQLIQYDLKGADFNDTLVWESPEGIKVKPFYNAEDLEGEPLARERRAGDWKIGQAIDAADPEQANITALHALEQGVEALEFRIPSDGISTATLLHGIDLQTTEVHCILDFLPVTNLQELLEGIQPDPKGLFLHADIIGHLARTGNWFKGYREDVETTKKLLEAVASLKGVHLLGIDGSLYQNAGANMVQQLAYTLAHAHEYLHRFGKVWQPPACMRMAVGSDYFFEIAKLRALRLLWKTLAMEYDISGKCHLMAVPSRRNKTLYDYNTNMLRTTSECMASILGGADTLVNLPYDTVYHKPNEFGDRMARNQLLILKHESHLGAVTNPADGAYYLETLTRQLAEKALALFKQVEAGGGFLQQLKEHTIQKKIRESAALEQKQFREGKRVLLGTNAYQHPDDRMKGEIEFPLFARANPRRTLIEPLIERRLSTAIEQKRLADE